MNQNFKIDFDFIYHKDGDIISSFDQAIMKVIEDQDISVICPYIGINYFSRLISLVNSWHLITDIEEWILSQSDQKTRKKIINFIMQNSDLIHHIKDVHAKVILTKNSAFLGSANLTENGIRNKIELSILIKNEAAVEELNQWFQNLWNRSSSISNGELDKFFESIKQFNPRITPKNEIHSLSTPEKISTRLVELISEKISVQSAIKREPFDKQTEERLIKILKYYPSKKWMNDFLNIVKKMIEYFEIKDKDVRIAMVIPKNGKRLPINIGQRWVIRPYVNGEIGLIMPLNYDVSNFKNDNAIEEEGYFYSNKKKIARWVHFIRKNEAKLSDKIMKYWYQAIENELKRTLISGRRKAHQSLYYRLATELDYRKKLLDKAFS